MAPLDEIVPPALRAEWVTEQNPLLTDDTVHSLQHQPHFWRCRINPSHIWQASLTQRLADASCPHCSVEQHSHLPSPGSLAAIHPDLAQAWHPKANVPLTANDVTPYSTTVILWMCLVHPGHLWRESVTEYVTHAQEGNPCPTCRYGWSTDQLRLFIEAILPHLDELTPSERFLLAQQAGLFETTGETRTVVEALLDLQAPIEELRQFTKGQTSLRALSQALKGGLPRDERGLPRLSVLPELAAYEDMLPIRDDRAIAFLVESGVQKLWRAVFDDPDGTLQSLERTPATGYAKRIKEQFLEEYRLATSLPLPPGYSFTVDGHPQEPTGMQRLIAIRLRDRRRIGNFSGTGSGKTLAALLASRVVEARTTIILAPNNVVPNWIAALHNAFPDADVQSKTLSPTWRHPHRPRYLIVHYELLQQPSAEAGLRQLLTSHPDLDCICIDEQHLARVRRPQDISLRRRRLNLLVTEASHRNAGLYVLAMTATPVINSLEEARSTLELVTGSPLLHLETTPSIANAMRMHQEMTLHGFRWVPRYQIQYVEHHVDIDCTEAIPRLLALPPRAGILHLEQLLLEVRLSALLDLLAARTIIYTSMLEGIIEPLVRAIDARGWRVGCFTGEDKTGFTAFLEGTIDTLIISDVAAVGVDGLQHVCHRLICLTLPWSHAQFLQLVGRLYRQGQRHSHVDVYLLFAKAVVKEQTWSYDLAKWDRIIFKRTLADAATDGVVPDAPLQSPEQAYRSLMGWLARLVQPNNPQEKAR